MAEIGSVLGGRYRLVELLGQGGMATVYRGHDSQLGRDVAVKVLRPEYGRDPDFLARFHAEAQAVASLNDPNIVSVFDFGEEEAGPYIVMEYVDGEDLATLLRRNGSLPPRQAARIARDVGRALAAAHDRGIVHRDIKPGNVLIANDGRVKVTDFGIARALSEAQLTLPGTTLGSVHYLSPEQVRGEPASAASDIYGLGIVLYEMLAGRRPFEGDTPASVAMGRLSGPAPGPSDVVSAIPPALDAIDRKALAPDPAERFLSAGAMAETLAGYLVSTAPATAPVASGAAQAVPFVHPAAGAVSPPPVAHAGPPGSSPVARPAGRIPYAADAYVADAHAAPPPERQPAMPQRPVSAPGLGPPPPEPAGTSPWVWISGLLGLVVLVVAGLLIYRFMTAAPSTPGIETVSVPNLVGQDIEASRVTASDLGLLLAVTTQTAPDQPVGTIVAQDPAGGASVARGSTIKVTVITGSETVAVPDVRLRGEVDGVAAIVAAGLINGTRTDGYDPIVPAGTIIGTNPQAGTLVARGTKVDYVVSRGPEPTASPAPSASPTATLEPTATPPPSASPTPTPPIVGDYRCLTLDAATAQLQADGFTLGTVTTNPRGGASDGTWLVQAQVPTPGESRPAGTAIQMTVIDPTSACP